MGCAAPKRPPPPAGAAAGAPKAEGAPAPKPVPKALDVATGAVAAPKAGVVPKPVSDSVEVAGAPNTERPNMTEVIYCWLLKVQSATFLLKPRRLLKQGPVS